MGWGEGGLFGGKLKYMKAPKAITIHSKIIALYVCEYLMFKKLSHIFSHIEFLTSYLCLIK